MKKILNPILNTDSYKFSHFLQYPPGTQKVVSYIEARGTHRNWTKVVFFGLQPFLHLLEERIGYQDVLEAKDLASKHGVPFNLDGWMRIVTEHRGRLPVTIQALREGSVVDIGTPLVQIVNDDPQLPWLTSYLETALLRAVWYPTTVATQSFYIKKALIEAGYSPEAIGFALNDFGARGASSLETARIGGAAHMTVFQGTDNVAAIDLLQKEYGAGMPGYSVIAAEHSTITSWGREREVDAYRNMLSLAKPGSIVSVVSDSYDIFNACRNIWGKELKDEVNALGEIGARLVVRPDSGDPLTVPIECISILMGAFGFEIRDGLKVLPNHVRVLQGDGINENSIKRILKNARDAGFHPDNLVFGMGGAMLQAVDRDTLMFAMKANAICIDGKWQDVYKDPVHGGKTSKRGIQAVVQGKAVREDTLQPGAVNDFRFVYTNGQRLATGLATLDDIKERIDASLISILDTDA